MCGVAGIIAYRNEAPPVDRNELLRVRDAMETRGPDGVGIWIDETNRVGLAHRRLAIIDLSDAATQPMFDSENGCCIVFNGEIYNYQPLRDELERQGCHFQSKSDTEVLLKLYAAHGRAMLAKLSGMYALAIWDVKEQGLFLARDPFGIKPLYFSDDGRTFRFASQVKALLKGGMCDTSPSPAGHVGFHIWGHVPEPFTLYKGIRSLPAGTEYWIDRRGRRSLRKHFSIVEEILALQQVRGAVSVEDAAEHLRCALLDSVARHLVSDVPVGVFLSAGLDSTTLLSLAKEVSGTDLHAVTLGFDEYSGTGNDEVPVAAAVARHHNTRHSVFRLTKQAFSEHLESFREAMDQPSIDGVNSYFVCMAAKQAGLKVALSGLGGDELFGGYSDFKQIPNMCRVLGPSSMIPGFGKGFRYVSSRVLSLFTSPKYASVFEYGGDFAGAFLLRRGLFMPWELPQILDVDLVKQGWRDLRTLTHLRQTVRGVESIHLRITALEMCWYMKNQLLRDTDWASMAHSIEVRVPMVDVELFRIVARLTCAGWKPTKLQLASMPRTPNLPEVLRRAKTGFSVPVRNWIDDEQKESRSQTRGSRGWAIRVYRSFNSDIVKFRKSTAGKEFGGSRPFRVGLLATELSNPGGVQSFMLRILEALDVMQEDGQVSSVCCLSTNDSQDQLNESDSIPITIEVAGAFRSKSRLAASSLSVLGNSAILIVGHVSLAPLATLLKRLGLVKRYFVILHGIEAWRKLPMLQRLALHQAEKIIATTNYTAAQCSSVNGISIERFSILPLCADERHIAPWSEFYLNGEVKVLYVARQDQSERYKGLDELLQAVQVLREEIPRLHLNLVGHGNDQGRLRARVKDLGITREVTFWGTLSDEELAGAYANCDLFAMPSKKEGFGIVFLEAMLRGKACIGGNHGGTPEVITHGESGFLVNFEDQPALVDCLRILATEETTRVAFGRRGREIAEARFSRRVFQETLRAIIFESAPN